MFGDAKKTISTSTRKFRVIDFDRHLLWIENYCGNFQLQRQIKLKKPFNQKVKNYRALFTLF